MLPKISKFISQCFVMKNEAQRQQITDERLFNHLVMQPGLNWSPVLSHRIFYIDEMLVASELSDTYECRASETIPPMN
jgi:hypothetical protein